MQIIFTWIIACVLCTICFTAWYVTEPLGHAIVTQSQQIYLNTGPSAANLARMNQMVTLDLLFNLIWMPIAVIVILLWAIISSSRHDIESEAMA